jgi:hypothetical protein
LKHYYFTEIKLIILANFTIFAKLIHNKDKLFILSNAVTIRIFSIIPMEVKQTFYLKCSVSPLE